MRTLKRFKLSAVTLLVLIAASNSQVFARTSQSHLSGGDFDLMCIYVTQLDGAYALELPKTGNQSPARHRGVDYFSCYGQLYSSSLGIAFDWKQDEDLFTALKSINFLNSLTNLEFTSIVRNESADYFNLLSDTLKSRGYGSYTRDSLPFLFVTKRSDRFKLEVKVIPGFFGTRANNSGERIVKKINHRRKQPVLNLGEGPTFIRALLSAFPDVEQTVVSQPQQN